jgi:hypothetical protein
MVSRNHQDQKNENRCDGGTPPADSNSLQPLPSRNRFRIEASRCFSEDGQESICRDKTVLAEQTGQEMLLHLRRQLLWKDAHRVLFEESIFNVRHWHRTYAS